MQGFKLKIWAEFRVIKNQEFFIDLNITILFKSMEFLIKNIDRVLSQANKRYNVIRTLGLLWWWQNLWSSYLCIREENAPM